MKKFFKEIVILFCQLFMFYIFPMFAGPTDAIGMVVLIILITLLLSFVLGIISNNKIRYSYPLVVSILFMPSIFLYYNESALIHSIWYFCVSLLGIVSGMVIKFIIQRINK